MVDARYNLSMIDQTWLLNMPSYERIVILSSFLLKIDSFDSLRMCKPCKALQLQRYEHEGIEKEKNVVGRNRCMPLKSFIFLHATLSRHLAI